jgi:hypothetical protein
MFFGFGKTSDYPIYPNSSLNTLPLNKSLFYDLIKYVIYRFCKSIFNYLPKFIQKVIKKYVWKNY